MELSQENFILLIVSGTVVLIFLAMAFIWLTVRNFKSRMKHQQEVFRHVMEAQEKERHRISRDLHEGIGADISAIKLLAGSIKKKRGEEGDTMTEILTHIDQTIESIRNIIRNLRPHEFSKIGLIGAITNFTEKIESKFPVVIATKFEGMDERFNDIVEINIYRIIQELINNSLKHSGALTLFLKMQMNDQHLLIEYKDDGKGFDPVTITQGMGTGNLKARTNFFNGTLELNTEPGKGVHYSIKFLKGNLKI